MPRRRERERVAIEGAREARASFLEWMRVLIVAGIPAGVLLVGLGSRLAMLVLRLTSPDQVKGMQSDDDFTIGQVTLSGTVNLLMLGAAVGVIGAGVHRLVAPWLLGPMWFRRLTTALASGVVAGSMLVHSEGIDFNVLKPTWLAIGLFVALPALFGGLVGVFVDAVARPTSWTARSGKRRWIVPIALLACFPPAGLVVLFAAPFVGACAVGAEVPRVQVVRASRPYGFAIRALWLLPAVLGLAALVGDIRAIVA